IQNLSCSLYFFSYQIFLSLIYYDRPLRYSGNSFSSIRIIDPPIYLYLVIGVLYFLSGKKNLCTAMIKSLSYSLVKQLFASHAQHPFFAYLMHYYIPHFFFAYLMHDYIAYLFFAYLMHDYIAYLFFAYLIHSSAS